VIFIWGRLVKKKVLFDETRRYLKTVGLPQGDYENFDISSRQFLGGGHYGIELSSMNNPKILRQALKFAKQYEVRINRVIECRGICRLPDSDIKEMVTLCASENLGLLLSIGPRAINDIGAFVYSENGKRVGYRLRGMENVIHAIEDIKRAIELGVRGFLIYDEGLLLLLNRMRCEGVFNHDIILKYSVHAGCSNPLSAKLLEDNGIDTINIIPDLDIWMIKTFRETVNVPLDVFSDTAKVAGGFLRTYDVPHIVLCAAPVYIKCGPISQPQQNYLPDVSQLEERIKQTRNVVEHLKRYVPMATPVNGNERTLALPQSFAKEKISESNIALASYN